MSRRIAVCLLRHHDAWALQIRRSSDALDGLWEFPGGGIEAGETPSQAAAREAHEETGIAVSPVAELPAVHASYAHGAVEIVPVVCDVVDVAKANAGVCWVSRAALVDLPMPAANALIIRELDRYLAGVDARP